MPLPLLSSSDRLPLPLSSDLFAAGLLVDAVCPPGIRDMVALRPSEPGGAADRGDVAKCTCFWGEEEGVVMRGGGGLGVAGFRAGICFWRGGGGPTIGSFRPGPAVLTTLGREGGWRVGRVEERGLYGGAEL